MKARNTEAELLRFYAHGLKQVADQIDAHLRNPQGGCVRLRKNNRFSIDPPAGDTKSFRWFDIPTAAELRKLLS